MKIGVVGAGQVGATAAYAMMMRGVGSEIVLVDINADLAAAQARDILEGTPFAHPVRLSAGGAADLDGAQIVVLAAGASQRPGETRLDLLSRNAEIFADIVPAVLAAAKDPIFLVATNPVDVITQIVTVIANRYGVPPERVIGSGTMLDSARFRAFIADELKVSVENVTAFVLGGHGDTMVPLPRYSTVAGIPITELIEKSRLDALVQRTRDGGAETRHRETLGRRFFRRDAAEDVTGRLCGDHRRSAQKRPARRRTYLPSR